MCWYRPGWAVATATYFDTLQSPSERTRVVLCLDVRVRTDMEAAWLILCLLYCLCCALPYSTFVHPLGLGSTVHVATGAITSYANSGALGCAWRCFALCWLTGGMSSLAVAGWEHRCFRRPTAGVSRTCMELS